MNLKLSRLENINQRLEQTTPANLSPTPEMNAFEKNVWSFLVVDDESTNVRFRGGVNRIIQNGGFAEVDAHEIKQKNSDTFERVLFDFVAKQALRDSYC